MTGAKSLVLVLASVAVAAASGMPEIPKASARALGVTRGKSFSTGVVFINGKYIAPPYVVERWGTGIRINSKPVTGPIIPWSEFLKTQEGVKVTKTEAPPPPPPPQQAAPASSDADDDTSLDDLFDDDPKPKKPKSPTRSASASTQHAAPKTTVSYSLDREFVHNAATRALVAKINSVRTEIDRILRNGGFICFGDSYSRVMGDSRSVLTLLEKLPGIQRRSDTLQEFRANVRSAGLVFLNEVLCEELFRNKVDYPRLLDRYEKLKRDVDVQKMLNSISNPLL